ncbi:hypothetical protein ACFE04_027074 [Oxalis oulophora]
MSFCSLSRLTRLSVSPNPLKTTSLLLFSTLSTADEIYAHLINNRFDLENTLIRANPKLHTKCVNDVMFKCVPNNSQTGLRFFIWAGLQSSYRHSAFMYSKACHTFKIKENPRVIKDIMENYKENPYVVNVKMIRVVLTLCKEAGLADEALWVFNKMSEFNLRADSIMYNIVIKLFIEKGDIDMSQKLMREMLLNGLYPVMTMCVLIIKGLCDVGRLEEACELFKVMRENGCVPNVVAYSTLLDGVCRFGSVDKALELLTEMEKDGGHSSPSVVTYTSVIQNFCEKGRAIEALGILERMQGYGCAPNYVTVNTLINGFCVDGHLEEAYNIIDKLVTTGCSSYEECYSYFVISLIRIKKVEEAERLFRKMIATGVKPSSLACSNMVKEIYLEERLMDGLNLCYEIDKISSLSFIDSEIRFNLLVGLCQKGLFSEAAKLVRLMIRKGIQLKASHTDELIKHFIKYDDQELLGDLPRIGR